MTIVFTWLDRTAIGLCLVVLMLGGLRQGVSSGDRVGLERTRDRVREALASLPDQLGPSGEWIKVRDQEVPPTQAEMLGVNAYVSREYQRLGDSSMLRATLFIANSSDARSMSGHHPPNCYPASGWQLEAPGGLGSVVMASSGQRLPVRIYRFAGGGESRLGLWVVNGFLMPDGRAVATLEETSASSSRAATSRLGLTQFQIVFKDDLPVADVDRYAGEVLGGLPEELFHAVGGVLDAVEDAGDGGGS